MTAAVILFILINNHSAHTSSYGEAWRNAQISHIYLLAN